jgi:fluoride exporter
MRLVSWVAIGAAAGGVVRYLVTLFIQERAGPGFPVATLLINVTGSLLLGFIVQYATDTPSVSPEVRLLLTTGFCGGYTTFSTFSFETARLMQDGEYSRAASYAFLSFALSIGGTFIGFAAARRLITLRRGI